MRIGFTDDRTHGYGGQLELQEHRAGEWRNVFVSGYPFGGRQDPGTFISSRAEDRFYTQELHTGPDERPFVVPKVASGRYRLRVARDHKTVAVTELLVVG
ncbi:MAG: hypothetical protein QOF21_1590 [Actinomycetota bacterium]